MSRNYLFQSNTRLGVTDTGIYDEFRSMRMMGYRPSNEQSQFRKRTTAGELPARSSMMNDDDFVNARARPSHSVASVVSVETMARPSVAMPDIPEEIADRRMEKAKPGRSTYDYRKETRNLDVEDLMLQEFRFDAPMESQIKAMRSHIAREKRDQQSRSFFAFEMDEDSLAAERRRIFPEVVRDRKMDLAKPGR